jgi:hypothetical protein
MELKGKVFEINGEHKKVSNTDENFAYFPDGARIKKELLVTKYEEVMDPEAFFNNPGGLEGLAKDINNIDPNKITESTSSHTNVNTHQPSTSQVIQNQPVEEAPVTRIDNTGLKPEPVQNENFFSKIKRNNTINIDFSVEEKFPDLDFVRMMNDNYETSIIDHFAREIVEKMVFDPETLMESVRKSITEIVYGKDSVQLREIENETPYSEDLKAENDNSETIEKITEERKVVETKDEEVEEVETKVEVIESASEEEMIVTKEKTEITPNEQKAGENTEDSSEQELEPEA